MTDLVDQIARDIAREAKASLDTHRVEVKGRLDNIDNQIKTVSESVSETRSFLKWFGGLLVTLMLSVLGWSLLQQYQANEVSKNDLKNQVELLQSRAALRQLASPEGQPVPATNAPQP